MTTTTLANAPAGRTLSTSRAAAAGIVATAAALGVSELLAGLLAGATSLVAAVGQALIDAQPAGAKDIVVALFGTNDKLAFELFIVAIAIAIGAGLGVLARRSYAAAAAVFIGFGVVGFLASLRDPLASPAMAGTAVAISIGVGLWVLGWLEQGGSEATSAADRTPGMPDWSRRTFMVRAGAIGVSAVAAGYLGRTLLDRQRVAPDAGSSPIPPATDQAVAPGPEADLSTTIADLTPIVMPNDGSTGSTHHC